VGKSDATKFIGNDIALEIDTAARSWRRRVRWRSAEAGDGCTIAWVIRISM
jgi:hypothetical protein